MGTQETGDVKHPEGICEFSIQRGSEAIETKPSRPSVEPARENNLCLDAFRIVLNDHDASEKRWFVSTLNLQLVSKQHCIACRLARVYHMRIASFFPWIRASDGAGEERVNGRGQAIEALPPAQERRTNEFCEYACHYASEIPRLDIRKVTWELSTPPSDYQLASDMERLMILGDDFEEDVRAAMYPPIQRRLTFSRDFNNAMRFFMQGGVGPLSISEPSASIAPLRKSSLLELAFGNSFNEELDESVLLPPSLRRITFGSDFNRPINRIAWPPSIRHLVFGWRFNQEVEGTSLPSSLRTPEFGYSFNKPIRGVSWPTSLRQLTFGDMFSQVVGGDGASGGWPKSLETLTFGISFNPANTLEIVFPKHLRSLVLGNGFNQPIDSIRWPDSLRELVLGDSFDRPIDSVRWPASLKRLTFGVGGSFNQTIDAVRWPPLLEVLEFGWKFNRPIARVEWPPCLRELYFGWEFDQSVVVDGVGIRWPPSLEMLTFGHNFNQPLVTIGGGGSRRGNDGDGDSQSRNVVNGSVVWPVTLRRLHFGGRFQQPLQGVLLPPSLVDIILGYEFNDPIDRVAWPSSLRRLTLVGRFNHAIRELPEGLIELRLWLDRYKYRHPLTEVKWPAGLRTLILPHGLDVDSAALPPGARIVRRTYHFGWDEVSRVVALHDHDRYI